MNVKPCVQIEGVKRTVGNSETSFRLTAKKGKLLQEDSGFYPDSGLPYHNKNLPILCYCSATWWATICSACWSTCPLGYSFFPWTGGRGPCELGGCNTSPGGECKSGGEAASQRSSEASGCGLGNPLPRRHGARGGRARS